jgi:DNA-binding NarL/FixJ family response regulator
MSASKPIRVLVADDHAVVRQGLCCLLGSEGHFEIIGEARNGREAVELTQTLQPAVVLMDIAMPLLNGLEATRQILATNPAARVIILSAHSDDVYVERMSSSGAAGFLEKQSSAELLTKAIRAVAAGGTFFSPAIAKRQRESQSYAVDRAGQPKPEAVRLTSRETEVLQLVAEGQANKQVAATLGISIKTVEKHRQHLMDKLNIHETASLTRYAIAQGIVESRVRLTVT